MHILQTCVRVQHMYAGIVDDHKWLHTLPRIPT